jgi:hypothetical protein
VVHPERAEKETFLKNSRMVLCLNKKTDARKAYRRKIALKPVMKDET